jgi:hypothetical protein
MAIGWTKTSTGDTHLLASSNPIQMVMLVRSKKELFTDFIEREAKSRGLKAMVNGSFIDLSFGAKVAVHSSGSALDPSESAPVGEVIQEGKLIAGSTSPGKFNFSQDACGAQRFSAHLGNPAASACAAIGGIAPIIIDGMPYGTQNQYRAGVPANAPATGDVVAPWLPFLVQKSNLMYTDLLKRGTDVGKTAVGYSKAKSRLVVLVQANDTSGDDANGVRTRLIGQGVENAVFLDCSDSATLYYDGKFLVRPGTAKNEYLTVAVGFK